MAVCDVSRFAENTVADPLVSSAAFAQEVPPYYTQLNFLNRYLLHHLLVVRCVNRYILPVALCPADLLRAALDLLFLLFYDFYIALLNCVVLADEV